ncbi:MAG: TonB-dependent receptor [Ignavibacteria bacterium]
MKILFLVLYSFTSQISFSQNKQSDSLYKIPFDTNKIKHAVRLSNTSEVFSYDSLYIWNDKRSLSEIMDARAGYFVNDFGLGGRNRINFNGFSEENIGIFRDGIQINEFVFGGFDVQEISVNEIDRIEEISNVSSFLYGVNTNGKALNVLTKDYFRPSAFSQLRYSQDRNNSLYADVFFNLPFSRKINWMFGGTKHSSDGFYENSSFDFWRGRTKFSYYPTSKINLQLNFHYNNIKRDLNEGLIENFTDSLLNKTADVVSPFNNEEIENYQADISATLKFFRDPLSLTKLKLFHKNYIRDYNGQKTIIAFKDSVVEFTDVYSGNRSGILASQNFNFLKSKTLTGNILVGANFYYDNVSADIIDFVENEKYSKSYYSGYLKADVAIGKINLSPMVKYEKIRNGDFLSTGLEVEYKLIDKRDLAVKFHGGASIRNNEYYFAINSIRNIEDSPKWKENYYELGISAKSSNIDFESYFFLEELKSFHNQIWRGINVSLNYQTKFITLSSELNYLKKPVHPDFYVKSDISYHNYFFKRKLNMRTGFTVKYLKSEYDISFNKRFHTYFGYQRKPVSENFHVDFYIGARIGNANVNLTLANIFNNLYYDSYLYPYNNRGGLGNVVSRFTIVWDFLN